MSNYPSVPVYGQYQNRQYQNAQFPPPPFPPPPPGNYALLPHMAQFQKGDLRYADAGHQVSNSSPNANAMAFTANNLHAPLPNGNAPYIPPLPHTFYPYSPFQNGAPSLPYPAVPPNQSSPNQGSTPVGQSANQNNSSSENQSPPHQGNSMNAAAAEESDKEMEDTSSMDLFAADREDGELSDSEDHHEPRAASPSRSPSQADFTRLAAKQATIAKAQDIPQGKSLLPCFHLYDQPWFVTQILEGRNGGSPASNPKPILNSRRSEEAHPSGTTTISNAESATKDFDHATEEAIRQQVKAALQDLHQHGIGYDSLVEEGLDPNTLRGLYSEVGIHVPLPLPRKPSAPNVLASVSVGSGLLPSREKTSAAKTLTSTPNTPDGSDSIQAIAFDSVTPLRTHKIVNGGQKAQPIPLPAAKAQLESATKESIPIGEQAKSSPKPVAPSKSQQSAPATDKVVDKAIDRKEYIAKLMAAKGGKAPVTKSAKPMPVTKVSPVQKSSPVTPASQAVKPSNGGVKSTTTQATLSEAEAKRAAQTELARKKMEALKQRNMSKNDQSPKRQTPQPASVITQSVTHQKESAPPDGTQPITKPAKLPEPLVKSQNSIPSQAPIPFTPSTSFFSSIGRSMTTSIPGLLMGNNASPSYVPSTSSSANPPVATVSTVLPIRRGSQPDSDSGLSLPDQISNPLSREKPKEVSLSDRTASNSEPTTFKPLTIGASTTPKEPRAPTPKATTANLEHNRKRPTASDFIDAPPARVKRRLGSHQQDNIILVFSEEEESEDEIERKDVEANPFRTLTASLPTTELKTKPIRDLPPLSDFPSRPKSLVNTMSTASPQVSTPGKATEQEVLKAKEEQILAMQRKIAEMEMKRASKRATGFSSPESSHVKIATRSSSIPPQTRQRLRSPSRHPTETRNLQAEIQESQPMINMIEATTLQQLLEPKAANTPSSSEPEAKKAIEAKNSHSKTRIAELEQGLSQIEGKVESFRSKLQVARREVTTLEEGLEALIGQQHMFTEELDLLKQEDAASIPITNQMSTLEKATAFETAAFESNMYQPGK